MPWQFILADAITGVEIGELRQGTGRAVTPRPIRRLGSAAIAVRADHWLVPTMFRGDAVHLKVYDPLGVLKHNGPLYPSVEKVINPDGTGSVAATSSSAGAILADRHVGLTPPGSIYGSPLAPADKSDLIRQVLAELNAIAPTGIIEGTITNCGSSGFVGPWSYKPGLDCITEIAAPLDGPDWEIEPIEPLANGGANGRLNVSAAFGQDRPNAVWEHGTGRRNVATWRHVLQTDKVANVAYNLPTGYPDNAVDPIVTAINAASVATRRRKEVIVAADLAVTALRQQLVDETIRVRNVPRQVITFDPTPDAAGGLVYGVDYQEGDLIRFHALERYPLYDSSGTVITGYEEVDSVDIVARLFAVTFTLDDV
jgi:hypothetical protein